MQLANSVRLGMETLVPNDLIREHGEGISC